MQKDPSLFTIQDASCRVCRTQHGVCSVLFWSVLELFLRAVDPRIIRERVREREAKIAAKENKVRPFINSSLVV